MDVIIWDWLSFVVRWVHVITGIAWIGSSFYFIAMDLGLRKREGMTEGVGGEAWQVHGGGFYFIQKYMSAPDSMPADLTWFKWESYMTWLSGFFLLFMVYYMGAELFLIDRNVLDISPLHAAGIGIVGLGSGWLVYDLLCRSVLGKKDMALLAVLFVFVLAAGWAFTLVFSGRGAFVHIGALIASIMTGNVFFIIIPNQKKVVADLLLGNTPDPALGLQAKQRSTHNNYLTLPVLFLMLSNHMPLAFASQWNWVIVGFVLAAGALVRHFFNTMHAHKDRPWWSLIVAVACFAMIVWLSTFSPADGVETGQVDKQDIYDMVEGNCTMCHAAEPTWDGLSGPPNGVVLESPQDIERHAKLIYMQAGRSNAMPPGNLTGLEAEDRALIVAWFEAGR
ncbi:MAG: urate hydroxylase PuuD [Rhodospirillales bacterium]|nr:urate hydroxylase PuuD [Rhodospirillales bacterium]